MPTETTTTTTSENLFGLHETETDQIVDKTLLFEAITTELEGYLLRESDDADSTGVVFDHLYLNRYKKNSTNCSVKIPAKSAFLSPCRKYSPCF